MVQKVLIIFCFETGDASVPYWDEAIVIDVGTDESIQNICDELRECVNGYLEAHIDDEIPYDYCQIVADVLNASDRVGEMAYKLKPLVIDTYRQVYV